MPLTTLGTLSYNGHTFSPKCRTESFSARPRKDGSGRTIAYTDFALTVRDYITANPADDDVELARRRLSKPGGKLVIQDRGVGTFNINVGRVKDVAWGPWPEVVEMRHTGADQTIELIWRVTFSIPDCTDAVFSLALMEVVYSASYTIDRSGLTTRVLSGYIKIPMTRKAVFNKSLPDSVDQYREHVNPPRIEGFRRIPGTFTVSPDRTRLDFSVTDEQFPTEKAPPKGCVDWTGSHSINTGNGALLLWNGSIEASYEVGRGYDPRVAYQHFIKFAKERLEAAYSMLNKEVLSVFLTGMSIAEPEINGRRAASFSLSFMINVAEFKDIFNASGLWRAVSGTDWQEWDASVGVDLLGVRGQAGLRLSFKDDVITDLCLDTDKLPEESPEPEQERVLRGGKPTDLFPTPKPSTSWLEYNCWIEVESESGTVELRSLPEKALTYPTQTGPDPGVQESLPGGGANGMGTGVPLPSPTGQPSGRIINEYIDPPKQPDVTVQRRAAPLVHIFLCGNALRVGYAIPVPKLTAVDGVKLRDVSRPDRGEGFSTGVVGNVGFPVVAAKWRLRFCLEGDIPKTGVEAFLPRNPLLESDDGVVAPQPNRRT